MLQSPADSPFVWVALDGHEVEGWPPAPAGCFASKDLAVPAVTVSVGKDAIWVVDRDSGRPTRVVRFEAGFPSFSAKLSDWGNSLRLAIAPDGSVAFYADQSLFLWQFSTGEVRFLAAVEREPEAFAVSPAARRLAIVVQTGSSWVAWAWSVPDGALLATLQWESWYNGSLSSFEFTPDGDGLYLSTDVSAQSGSDFSEGHGWKIGAGPEAAR